MSTQLYNGITTPHWNEIDKIHYGSAKTLKDNARTDGIMLGRYVLVQYVAETIFSQDEHESLSVLNNSTWNECYREDGEKDYDGMVFKKIYDAANEKITYTPIAQLSATLSSNYISNKMSNYFYLKDNTYNKTTADQTFATINNTYTKTETNNQIQTEITKAINALKGNNLSEAFDTLKEVENYLNNNTNIVKDINSNIDSIEANIRDIEKLDSTQTQQINTNILNINELTALTSQHTTDIGTLTHNQIQVQEVVQLPDVQNADYNIIYQMRNDDGTTATYYKVVNNNGAKRYLSIGMVKLTDLAWQIF